MKIFLAFLMICSTMSFSSVALTENKSAPSVENIENYVRQVHIHGVPYAQASKIDSSAIPILLTMLNNPLEEAHWANVVVILEMIGDDSVVKPLIRFIEKDPGGVMSRNIYTAKTSAIMGMGYLINRTGNKQALAYLTKGVKPQYWQSRDVQGIVDYHMSVDDRNQDMSQYAILGLALSGHPDAANTLKSLQQTTFSGTQSAYQQRINDLLDGALDANAQIGTNGLTKYYQHTQH